MPAINLILALPVVDIDGTFFVQGGIFLALVVILNPLLFKPWLATLARREEAIGGALSKAKTLRGDADALAAKYDERLADARDRAAEYRSSARTEEESSQAKVLAAARSDAASELAAARKQVSIEAEEARSALAGRVDELAGQITTKILGRAS